MSIHIRTIVLSALIVLLLTPSRTLSQAPKDKIDWNKAKQLRQKEVRGLPLTPEEQAYLKRAREARRQLRGNQPQRTGKPSLGLIPLTNMTAKDRYKEQEGGLYGAGSNVPPKKHLEAALRQASRIQPLDEKGKPSKVGKIVMISTGMSNTTQEFSRFVRIANGDRSKSQDLILVDGAQGGMDAKDWAVPDARRARGRPGPWEGLDQRLKRAGVSPQQVQVAWILQARKNPASLGAFPKHAEEPKGHLLVTLNKLKERFPNLRIVYFSSRIYAGYATGPLNPEPYAYESAFTIRWLIQDQIKGVKALNYDPDKGKVQAPLLLWGPYLWADGEKRRKGDDLIWKREDLARDGTHPSLSGRDKVAKQLLSFFKTDPTTKTLVC